MVAGGATPPQEPVALLIEDDDDDDDQLQGGNNDESKKSWVERARLYFKRLSKAFGWRYVFLVILVYGVNQGVGEAFLFGAQRYFFLDQLGVSAARFTQYEGFANIPWQIKAVYGMASDSFTVFGYKRSPYMIVAGILGVLGAFVLSSTPATPNLAAVFLIFMNFSIASPDVMVDASAAERAKTHPDLTADVQSLCWGSLHFFNFFATASVGYLLQDTPLGPRGVFGLMAFTSLACLIPASLGWLGEKRASGDKFVSYAAVSDDAAPDTSTTTESGVVSAMHTTQGGQTSAADDGIEMTEKSHTARAVSIEDEDDEEDPAALKREFEAKIRAVASSTEDDLDDDESTQRDESSKQQGSVLRPGEDTSVSSSWADKQRRSMNWLEKTLAPKDPKLGVFSAAMFTCGCSVTIGFIQVFYNGPNPTEVEGGVTAILGTFLACSLWFLLRPVSAALSGTAVYIFLEGCFQPQTEVIFDWSHSDGDNDGNCAKHCDDDEEDDDLACGWARERDYPCIDPVYYQWMKAMVAVFAFLGVVFYNAYFSDWPFRKVLLLGQFVYFFSNMMDWVWTSRLNLTLHLNDHLFLFGTDAIQPFLKKLHLMPIYVLAARLCPANVEATLFALLMGLSNFGSNIGLYHGVALLHVFGGVERPEYRHLPAFVFVRTIIYLAPMALVLIFIPYGSPSDYEISELTAPAPVPSKKDIHLDVTDDGSSSRNQRNQPQTGVTRGDDDEEKRDPSDLRANPNAPDAVRYVSS